MYKSIFSLRENLALTLGQTLVGQCYLSREQIEVETAEDTDEGRNGDETVGSTCLQINKQQKLSHAMQRSNSIRGNLQKHVNCNLQITT